MRRLSDTIAKLNAARPAIDTGTAGNVGHLSPLTEFGSNPGALAGWTYVPAREGAMPLVVVLHGCTQSAAGYDNGSGWSDLAERFGFALLFPEQNRANNPNNCFNWFVPEDVRRDSGEAASIRQMVSAMVARHAIDTARIFVTGLSAGGAMTSAMLATYPEVFAGGAVIAGLPHGSATSMLQAFDRMRGHGHPGDDAYASAILAASPHAGPWPTVSVWHGSADATVDVANADRIVGQWRVLQGFAAQPDSVDHVAGHRHRRWNGPDGRMRIEEYRISGMGHGTPLRTDGDTACGTTMPYMLDVGLSSSWHIAESWGLLDVDRHVDRSGPGASAAPSPDSAAQEPQPSYPAFGLHATIEAALRSAGLMR